MRVLLIEDDSAMARSIELMLRSEGLNVYTTDLGEEGIDLGKLYDYDIIVLDLQLPDMPGVEVTYGLLAACPGTRVLILSASGEQQDVLDAVKAGAAGYLIKSASRTEFLDAVRRTAAGDAVFSPGLAGLVLGEFRRLAASPAPGTPRLTEREAEILRMVGTGLSYKQIAERLVLSHRTVQNHVQNTLAKLHLHNRVELVRYAIEHRVTFP